MRVINKKLVASFRVPGRCECCGRPCPDGRDPHHLHSRGAGQIDIRQNLISLCRDCHTRAHAGGPPNMEALLKIVAKREKTRVKSIVAMVMRLRADNKVKVWRVDDAEN